MYKIIISNSAEREIERLPATVVKRISSAIDGLITNRRPIGCKKLKGSNENLWRIRVGDYRIEVVDIRRVRHRKDVYK